MLDIKKPSGIRSNVVLMLLFAVYPILAFPFILIEIYNNKRFAYSCLSIFCGYAALLYPPTGDLYRYTIDYLTYSNLDYLEFSQLLDDKIDYLHAFFLWFLGRLEINCDISRFIYVWFSCELIFSIFYNLFLKFNNKKERFIYFLILILLLSFVSFLYRYGFSVVLFVYGTYQVIYNNNRIKGYIYIFFACLNHFSIFVFFIPFIIQDVLNFKGNKLIVLVCLIGTFIFSSDIISQLIRFLPFDPSFIEHLLVYTDGYYAEDFFEDHSLKFRLGITLQKINYLAMVCIYYINYKDKKISGWITIILMILFVFSPFAKIKGRFEHIIFLTSLIYVMDLLANKQIRYVYKTKRILILVGLFYTCVSIWTVRRQLIISEEHTMFLPTYSIITSTYTEKWLNNNLYVNGDLKSQ